MKLDQRGLLIVISGPSGVGKGTVRNSLFKRSDHDMVYSISMTTRKPRNGEVDGRDYYFVSEEEFLERIEQGKFLEYAKFIDNYYGTPLDKLEEQLANGNEVVLEIEINGAMQVKKKRPDAIFIFIAPPTLDDLNERLHKRGTESEEIIQERCQKAVKELAMANLYDYIVVNDDVDNAADKILAIVRAEHARTNRCLEEYNKIIRGVK